MEVVSQVVMPAQADHADQAPHPYAPVDAGQDAARVCVRCSCRVCVMLPSWPDGHASVCDAVRVSVFVCMLGFGSTQAGAHVLDVVAQALHPPQVRTGAAQASGQA